MKKLSLLLGGIILSTAVMAQKPTEGAPMSVEGQIGLTTGAGGKLGFNAPALRLRYFVTESIAVRLTVGLDNSKRTLNAYEFGDGTGGTGSYEFKQSATNLALGAEYHFKGTERLSPFVGLDFKFGMGGMKESGDQAFYNGVTDEANYALNYTEEYSAKMSMFGANLVAGADFYFAQNFYVGMELGLGFAAMTAKEGSREVTVGALPAVTSITPEQKWSSFSNGNALVGNFRLGWRF